MNKLHFKDGQLFTAFEDRPEETLALDVHPETAALIMAQTLNVDDVYMRAAIKIVVELSREHIDYATSPERGNYRGFAALHDLFDANDLLPTPDGGWDIERDTAPANAIMDRVTGILCGLYRPIRKGDRLAILGEWQDEGDDEREWFAIEDEAGGRVAIQAASDLPIPPWSRCDVRMVRKLGGNILDDLKATGAK